MRRALLVGLDDYPGRKPLSGCENDARRMQRVLAKNYDGSPNFACQLLLGSAGSLTRAHLRSSIRNLLKDPADVALLHFSGHGTVTDTDGFLVTQDGVAGDEGVPMSEVLQIANESRVREVVIVLDCCNSGQFGAASAISRANAYLREGLSILAGSRADQASVEEGGGGLFTSLLVDALEGAAADLRGHVTASGMCSFAEAALGPWDQRPQFKSHVAKVFPVRLCEPPVPTALLRELPAIFPVPAEDLQLDPSFERTSPTPDPAKVRLFEKLQCLNRVHLVVPVGPSHMYGAAMESAACRLTGSGRYYWRLANAGLL